MTNYSISDVLEDIKHGKFVIVVDSEDRENEGDLVMAGELITPDAVNFMAREARGLICVSIPEIRAQALSLERMAKKNTSFHETAFTVSVDAAANTSTGISAQDRFETIRVIADNSSVPDDLVRPGHIFPIVGHEGGVLRRAGHTEASMDLSRLAGLKPIGVICEILAEDGSVARKKDLELFAEKHDLKILAISDLIRFRRRSEKLIKKIESVKLPTPYGKFDFNILEEVFEGNEHIALTFGKINKNEKVMVRVHSECLTGDVFHSERCDCGQQLDFALREISKNGSGILVYLKQEGRGIGLKHKIKAYKLQEEGLDTVEANKKLGFEPDLRDYGIGAQILHFLNARKLILLTNNPMKLIGLEGHGLEIVGRVPVDIEANENNREYLATKKEKLGHLLKKS